MRYRATTLTTVGLFFLIALASGSCNWNSHQPNEAKRGTALVLQPQDGEKRVRRPPPATLSNLVVPFLLKVDPSSRNGAAQDFVVLAEDIPVGETISPHRHPNAEELLFIHTGHGTAWLNGKESKLQPGTLIFMPRNTGVKVTNDGNEPIALIAIFSRPGIESYFREFSVPAGETPKPLSRDELNAIRARHRDAVIYDQK